MKKLLILCVILILSLTSAAFAGSIPEDLLNSDMAQIFFAQVTDVYSSKDNVPYVEVVPWKVIKGEVNMNPESRIVYYNPNTVGDFELTKGKNYLFTYLDENNPTDIFEVTSYDPSVLKLEHTEGDMWKRFEQYLNEGRYLDAEQERIDRQNEQIPVNGNDISLVKVIGVAREDAESVNIHYYGKVYEIDAEDFYKAIDGIMLKDIEDVSLEKRDGNNFSIPNGMYITVNGFDGYAFITDDCKVDKYGLHYSSLPVGAYTIKVIDRAKITALFAEDEYDLPFHETAQAKRLVYIILFVLVISGVLILMRKRS